MPIESGCSSCKRGLNPWIEECPRCGCANPKYDPQAVSDIEPPDTMGMDFNTALGIFGAVLARKKHQENKK